MSVDGFACVFLPGPEFFHAHAIARASFGEGKKAATDGCYDFQFIADGPALVIGGREIAKK